MGNSCKRCFGIHKTNIKYVRSDLTQSQDLSIEFENLMTNDYYDELTVSTQKNAPFTVTSYMKWLSDQERSFMEDDEDEPKGIIGISNQIQPKENISSLNLVKENSFQSNKKIRNWCTFDDETKITNGPRLSDDQLTGYFLDELSRDIEVSRAIVDPNKPLLFEEEEIDGPELARLIRKMRPRDLFLTGGSGDLLTTAHSSIFIGNSAGISDTETSHLSSLYTKIHQNLMKGIGDTQSAVTSERDQSSVDLDWDHEPGMNPSLAFVHKRTDTEEDLVNQLTSVEPKIPSSSEILNNTDLVPNCKNHLSSNKPAALTSTESNSAPVSPIPSLMSPDQMFYNDELAWDVEGEIFVEDVDALRPTVVSGYDPESAFDCPSYIVHSDKSHLLQD